MSIAVSNSNEVSQIILSYWQHHEIEKEINNYNLSQYSSSQHTQRAPGVEQCIAIKSCKDICLNHEFDNNGVILCQIHSNVNNNVKRFNYSCIIRKNI